VYFSVVFTLTQKGEGVKKTMWNGYFTVKELAEELGYTPQNITKMVREGKIAYIKRGRQYFFEKRVKDGLVKRVEAVKESGALR